MSSRGSALVSALIGAAILGIMAAAFATMMDQYQRQSKALAQKLEILELKQSIMTNLASSSICGCNFDPMQNTSNSGSLSFDGTSVSSIKMDEIYSRCVAGAPASPVVSAKQMLPGSMSGLKAGDVTLGVQPDGAGGYQGVLTVDFDSSGLVIARQPVKIDLNLQVDDSAIANSTITGCSTVPLDSGGSGGGATIGKWVKPCSGDIKKCPIPKGTAKCSPAVVAGALCTPVGSKCKLTTTTSICAFGTCGSSSSTSLWDCEPVP